MFDRFGDERRETREKEAERSGERIGGERRKEKTERREEVGKRRPQPTARLLAATAVAANTASFFLTPLEDGCS